MKLPIARKLRLSFLLVTALFLCSSVVLYKLVIQVENHANSLLQVDLPTVDASRSIQQSVQASMSSLRAYMLLGANESSSDVLKQDLISTVEYVDNLLPTLKARLSQNDFNQIELQWQGLVASQNAVTAVTHSEENLPAHALLRNEAAPIAEVALDQLQGLLNEEENNPIGGERKRLIKLYADSYNTLANSLSALRDYLFYGQQAFLDKYQDLIIRHNKAVAEIETRRDRLNNSDLNLWQLFIEMQQMYFPLVDQVITLRQAPDWNKANYLMAQQTIPASQQLEMTLEQIVKSQQADAESTGVAINTGVNSVIWMLVVTALVASICSLIIGTWLGRSIGQRLSRIADRAENISHGDFSGQPLKDSGSDELTTLVRAINRMTQSLSSLVKGVTSRADDVDQNMNRLLDTNSKTAGETLNQANKINSMATAIEQMSVTANETAQNTQDASDNLHASADLLAKGEQALNQNKETVEQLHRLVSRASDMVQSLSNESDRIERVTEVIESVAAQTNLLALNAAIEAARAGEQGRGFAVVADEVRLLAQRTTDSTTEINTIVDAIQTSTEQVVSVIEDTHQLVQAGTEHTAMASAMLQESINNIQGVSHKVSDVAVSTEQQSSVSQSLTDLVHQLSDSADGVSQNCDSASTTSQEVKNKVVDLNKAMSKFAV